MKATADSFVGRLERYEAVIVVDPETASADVVRARFAFRFADVKTGKDARDEAMHSWQDTAHHPDGIFTLAAIEQGADGGRAATGTLVLHGRSREISFPVSVSREGGLYAIDGEATLDTRDFGLPVIKKLLLLKVDPAVKVRFHLQGRAVPEGK
jgi:polyisoprenoid-binding protein YceI